MKLGVNIDHVATLRQARREEEPDLIFAAKQAIEGGADGITIHLREDRRHIQDADVLSIRHVAPRLNLEMAATEEMVRIAASVKPDFCCIVAEKRQELTTEGGLDVAGHARLLSRYIAELKNERIQVSLFIDPDFSQIEQAKTVGADFIELHTGRYAKAAGNKQDDELQSLRAAVSHAVSLGLRVNAGHGLKYHNVRPVAKLKHIEELNIGHSIVSRAIFVGIKQAVSEMKTAMA